MTKEEQILCGHLLDLAETCYRRDIPVHSDFLSLAEQDLFFSFCAKKLPPVEYTVTGGYESSERKIIYFQPIGAGYDCLAPMTLIRIQPQMEKFAEELSHRDFLGSLMNLGMERSQLGDLIVREKSCLLVCSTSMADYICDNLIRVRHTSVTCQTAAWDELASGVTTREVRGTVASIRLDTLISLAFSTSRSKMTGLIEGEKVFINGRCIPDNDYVPAQGDLISVRGHGKFRFDESGRPTKKGRISVTLQLFV